VLPSPQQPSNFNRSILTDDHRPPSPPAHRGQLTPSLSAPPQLISQHYINPVKLYDPSIGPLEHPTGSPTSSRRSPSAAARPRRRHTATELLNLHPEYQQHHIIQQKLPSSSSTTLRHSSYRNNLAAVTLFAGEPLSSSNSILRPFSTQSIPPLALPRRLEAPRLLPCRPRPPEHCFRRSTPPPATLSPSHHRYSSPRPDSGHPQVHTYVVMLSHPSTLTAGDHRRRNKPVKFRVPSLTKAEDHGLEDTKVQGVICKTLDSEE
jgi:hypothetical protein